MGKGKEAGPGEMLLSLAASPEAPQRRGKQVHPESSAASPVNADPQVAQEAPYRWAGVLRAQSVHLAQQCSDLPAPHSWWASPTDRNPNTSPRDTCRMSLHVVPRQLTTQFLCLDGAPEALTHGALLRSGVHSEQTLVRVRPLLSLRAPSWGTTESGRNQESPKLPRETQLPVRVDLIWLEHWPVG